MTRRDELRNNLAALDRRVGLACEAAGRDSREVTVVIVTKTWPADDVRLLAGLGVTDVGENRDQEAAAKHAVCVDLDLRWHFVGQLQRNKAASVAGYADFVHSVDRESLAASLDRGAQRAQRRIGVFVQVDLRLGPDTLTLRGGATPDRVQAVCAAVGSAPSLDLVGLMAVAPLGEDPAVAFDRLNAVREPVIKEFPEARSVSAGMSGDLEAALAAGATHVRVGSAVLGVRHNVR